MIISILSPKGLVFEGTALSARIPTSDGLIGILPNHAALLTKLGIGKLEVESENSETKFFEINGGILEVADNSLTILSN